MINGTFFTKRISEIKKYTDKFFYGEYYLWYLALFAAFFYCAYTPLLNVCSFALLGIFLLVIYRDLTPIIPIPVFIVLGIRDFSVFSEPACYVVLALAAIAVFAHFFIYPIKKIFIGKLFFPLVAVSIALFIGGLFSEHASTYFNGIVTIVSVGPVMLFAYFWFSQYICPPKDFKLADYIFSVFTFIGVCCFIEIVAHTLFHVKEYEGLFYHVLGWGNINSAGTLLLLALASCAYLIIYGKHRLRNIIFLILIYVAIFSTSSDGVSGIAIIFTPIIMFFTITSGRLKSNKYQTFVKICTVFFSALVLAIVVIILIDKQNEILEYFLIKLSNDNRRTELYLEAWELFKKYPILGVGQGYSPTDSFLQYSNTITYNFHSSIIHVFATMGVVGAIAYVYYFIERYKIITNKHLPANLFAYFAFTMFEIYAAIDTAEFSPIPLLLSVTILLLIVEQLNVRSTHQPLPLSLHTHDGNLIKLK